MNVEKIIYEEVKKRCNLPSNVYGIGAWEQLYNPIFKVIEFEYLRK